MKLPKKLTTVTPFSRALALILFIVLPVAAFYLGTYMSTVNSMPKPKYQSTNSKAKDYGIEISEPPSKPYERFIKKCDGESCLVYDADGDAMVGYGKLTGYLTTYSKAQMDGTSTTCNALVVQSGSNTLIKSLRDWVENKGNGINRINENDELLVNLDLTRLPATQLQRLRGATKANPAELGLIRVLPIGMDANPCDSFVEILTVK